MNEVSEVQYRDHDDILARIGSSRIVAILRGDLRGKEIEIVKTLLESGISTVEVTLNSPRAFEIISDIHKVLQSSIELGAGTVLRTDQVLQAFDCGAKFIVSPNMAPAVIRVAKNLDMASFPGCATCTEILQAFDYGADAVKVFPANTIGPEGIRAILSSLGNLRLIPTGGITRENAAGYLAAGAWALGVGSALVDSRKLESTIGLRGRALEFAAIAAAERGKI